MRLLAKLALLFALFAGSAFAQGSRYDNILLGPTGSPKSGATVAVCQSTGLATTAASVSSNVATLTMASAPKCDGVCCRRQHHNFGIHRRGYVLQRFPCSHRSNHDAAQVQPDARERFRH